MTYKLVKTIREKSQEFLCALCSKKRKMRYGKNLNFLNYIQIILISISLFYLFWNSIGVNSLLILPLIWGFFEFSNKILYRRELPCPHCGFDATWYKRDIKIAKAKVEKFWKDKDEEKVPLTSRNADLEDILQ